MTLTCTQNNMKKDLGKEGLEKRLLLVTAARIHYHCMGKLLEVA